MSKAPSPVRKRPTGRRAGESGTRDAIIDAAKDLFSEQGYDGTSIRAIAARAQVDPGLIRHFFTNKETLFAITMADRATIPDRLACAFNGDPAELGYRLTRTYLELWEDPITRPILLALVRSAMTSQHGTKSLIETLSGRVRDTTQLPSPDHPLGRAMVVAVTHLLGTAIARYILKIPIISDMPLEELIDQVSPTIQQSLTRG